MKGLLNTAIFGYLLIALTTISYGETNGSTEIKDDLSSSNKRQPRLAGAQRVNAAECPYYVSIQNSGSHVCGGALITKTHILTAAHCIQPVIAAPYLARQLSVELGSEVIGGGSTHTIKRLSYHSNYKYEDSLNPHIQANDVAVITLTDPVIESEHVRAINLPPAGFEIPVGSQVKVSGFGSTRLNAPMSSILQKSDLFIVSHAECERYFVSYLQKRISSTQLCASRGVGYGTCQGDSGGPMVYNNLVVGLVSAGDGKCEAGTPDIYTKVASFLTYILSELSGGNDNLCIALDLETIQSSKNHLYPYQYPATLAQQHPNPGKYSRDSQYPVSQQSQNQYPAGQYPMDHYP